MNPVYDLLPLFGVTARRPERGGSGDNRGKSVDGLPMILRTIRKREGRSPIIGLTFCATGLYFFIKIFMFS